MSEKRKNITSKKEKTYSIGQFRKDYPDEATCLDKIFQIRYGKLGACPECGVVDAKFKRITTRRCYQCCECEHQFYPTAGTVFEKTRTPLTYWFYAIYLYTVTRNGVAAKELQRQLKVTYKTAWRMADQIRKIMVSTSTEQLTGLVIADETYIGGLERNKHKHKRKKGTGPGEKIAVFGMMSGGRIIAKVLDETPKGKTLKPIIRENVHKDSTIVSDGFGGYKDLNKEFKDHQIVKHENEEYVNKDGYSTNAIESHWSSLKRMIKGTHIHVHRKHLPKYIAENIFRYENRGQPEKMFEIILQRLA